MKKNYFMLALATTMMAACANNDLVEDVLQQETPQAIEFETFANKQTRGVTAENSSAEYTDDLYSHHTTFDVWGYKSVQSDYVFDAKVVNNTDGNGWTYTGLAYWDKAASFYEFYASAPTNVGFTLNKNDVDKKDDDYFEITANHSVKDHTINDDAYVASFKGITNAVDLMIADKKNVPLSEFKVAGYSVQLSFIHILSRLNITVAKDATELPTQTVVLKSLELHNVNNTGTFDENKTLSEGKTLNSGTHERWTTTSDVLTYNGRTNVELDSNAKHILQSLIMPQTAGVETVALDGKTSDLKEPYFTIVYTITDNDNIELFSASYNLARAFGNAISPLPFNEGWQNTLNITIKPSAITFTGNVATWGTTSTKNPTIE